MTGFTETQHPLSGLILRIIDVLLLLGALFAISGYLSVDWVAEYTLASLVTVVIFLLAAGPAELYDRGWVSVSIGTESRRIFHVWAWVIAGLLLFAYVTKTTDVFSRLAVTSWFILVPAILLIWRVIWRYIAGRFSTKVKRKIAIAGAGRVGEQLAEAILSHPNSGLSIEAFYDDFSKEDSLDVNGIDIRINGNLDQMIADVKSGEFDEIYMAIPMRAEGRIREMTDKLADSSLPVFLVPDLFAFTLLQAKVSDLAGIPIVSVYGTPHHGASGFLKRTEDVLLGLMILTIIMIPMLFIALAIKVTSPGPVFFKQRRYGMGGEEVMVWKFRSMSVMEEGSDVTQATKNDPRVTKLGRFLRRTSMDELPQFLNVLQGHLTIVGPRPHAVTHNEEYRKLIQGYMLRHLVKPGITGWAQVNGWRGETDTLEKMEKRIEYDLEYIRNWSVWFDIKIIFMTVISVISGRQAY